MSRLLFAGVLLSSMVCVAGEPKHRSETSAEDRLPLWNHHAPIGGDKFSKEEAWITVHRPRVANGAAVVICPGGGYHVKMMEPEGHGIARWLNRHGITGVVLDYRLPAGRPYVPLLDAQRAIRMVRANSREWNLDPARIGVMGFSAGGHLASTAATHFDDGNLSAADPINGVSCRPDFAILIYPVIKMGETTTHKGSQANLLGSAPPPELVRLFSNEKQVTSRTPPTFLAHALNDTVVPPDNSRAFHQALLDHNIASEFLELPSGGHGLNGYKGPMWDAWQEKSLEWLAKMNFIPHADVSRTSAK
ncbi:MAG TPA: alpha/beta hydrolase [Planctomycetaceae bacterium]|jgi:acetyl esterase/lipase|nr:alpha/beta hydrolase [Planctomycetaceae bacterium]